jgi:hypothetical protein
MQEKLDMANERWLERQRIMDRIMSLHETVITKLVRAEAAQAETQLGSTCLSNHEHIEHTPGVSSRHENQEFEGEQKQEAEGNHTGAHPNALENYDSQKPNDSRALTAYADEDEVLLEPVSKFQLMQAEKIKVHHSEVEMGEVRPGLHRVEGHACPEVALLESSRVKEYEAERMSTNGEEVDAGAGARDHREENTDVKTLFTQNSPETGQATGCLERGGDGSQHAQHELITEGGNVNNPRGPEMDAFIDCAMHRNIENYSWSARGTNGMPAVSVTVASITDLIKVGYKASTNGKLAESGAIFKSTLQSAMVARVDSKGELDELREQMSVFREYLTADVGLPRVHHSTRREQFKEDPKRNMEPAAYLTHCNLQPLHMLISLHSAISSAVKVKNFNTAASLSRRLVQLNPKSEHNVQALKVLKVCDTNRTNEVDLFYDDLNPFVVCTKSFMPVYRGQPLERCGFCTAAFDPKFKGQVCPVCEIGEIGFQGTGITSVASDASSQPQPQTQAQPFMQAPPAPPTGLVLPQSSSFFVSSILPSDSASVVTSKERNDSKYQHAQPDEGTSCRVKEVTTGSVANHTTESAHPMSILRKSPSVRAGGKTVQFINVSPGSRGYNVRPHRLRRWYLTALRKQLR